MESSCQSFCLEKYEQLGKVSPILAAKKCWPVGYIQKISSSLWCPKIHWRVIRTNISKFHLEGLQTQCYSERIYRKRMEPSLSQGTIAKIQGKIFQRSSRYHDYFGRWSPRSLLQQPGPLRRWPRIPNRIVLEDKVPWGKVKERNGYPKNDWQFEAQAKGVSIVPKRWFVKWWTNK